jgi:nucleoside-diphosphate-sugar epimerase
MRITVTGAGGFIGQHVAAAAARRGHEVLALARPGGRPAPVHAGINAVSHDLRTREGLADRLRGSDAVVHCAAAMGGDLASQRAITVDGTRNLLDAMAAAGVRRIVGIGTFAVYDTLRIPVGAMLDESSPLEQDLDARAPYIRVKLEQEELIRDAATENGWSWTILRPGLVFGPDRTWFHHLGVRAGPVWLCLAPEGLLPLTHVENCADAIVLAAESDAASGKVLNIVDDDLPTRREYMKCLAERTHPHPRATIELTWPVLDALSRGSASLDRRLLHGRAPLPDLLRPASLHARCKPLRYTNARVRQTLAWDPRVSWREGMEASVPTSASP